jgi:O-antigen/teichoic acid export membrane protein
MSTGIIGQARDAMRWRALQLVGIRAIYFLRLLILAKLLVPEDFGLLAIATIAVGTLMTLSNVGMISALVQRTDPSRDQEDGAWTVGMTRAVLVGAVLVVVAPWAARLFNAPAAAPLIQVLALRPLLDAAASIGVARLTRDLEFRSLALIYFPGAVLDLLVAVVSAPVLGVWALVAGTLAGSVATLVASYLLAPHRPRLMFRWTEIEPLINFGRWVLGTGVVAMAGTLLTQLAVSRILGASALGMYFLAVKVAFLPLELLNAWVGSVAFPLFARLRDDAAGSTATFGGLLGGLGLIVIPAYGLLFALASSFEQVLGPDWAGTAPIIHVLCLAGITALVGELLVPFMMGRGRADRAFRLEVVQTGALLAVLVPAMWALGIRGAALAWLVGNALAMLAAISWARQIVPGALGSALPRLGAALLAGLAGAALSGMVAQALPGLPGLIAAGCVGMVAVAATLWLMDRWLGLGLGAMLALVLKRSGA